MSKHPLLVVCALAFTVGGAAAVALHYQPNDAAEVRAVAEVGDDAGREVPAESDSLTVQAAEGAPAEEESAPAEEVSPAAAGDEAEDTVEAVDGVKDGTGVAARRAYKRAGGVRDVPEARPRAVRRYEAIPRGGGGSVVGSVGGVGRGVAGHTVRGVKKTGMAIGKTFGKIGGVFHD